LSKTKKRNKRMYDPDKCSSFYMMFGFSQTMVVRRAKKKKNE